MRMPVVWRIGCTVAAITAVEGLVCGLAAAPVVGMWLWVSSWTIPAGAGARVAVFSIALVPAYVVFALGVMAWSALATRVTGARTPPNARMPIVDFDWRLMSWVRYMAAIHVVRVLAGALFRGSPIWTLYLRLNGARFGRRVYVNTTFISDHNLLEFGDDVVIGADVHLSGHIVESGIVKTAAVRLGSHVTIGLGSVVDIDVEAGDHCQVGALSLVPKHAKLEAGRTYAGIPARPID